MEAGIGQDWDHNPVPLLGCDLTNFEAHVPDPHKVQAARATGTDTFTVPRGVKKLAVELTADGPEPKLTVTAPNGQVVARTTPTGTRGGPAGAVVAPAGSNVQYLFAQNPPAGTYTVSSDSDAPQLTGIRLARDAAPLSARASIARVKGHPGRRRVLVNAIKGLSAGDALTIGVQTPAGVMPLGTATGATFSADYDELGPGPRAIVAGIERDGVPLPGRTRVIAKFKGTVPPAAHKLSATRVRKGRRVLALARPGRSAEVPDAWQYVLRTHGRALAVQLAKPGKPASFKVEAYESGLTVSVRPVVLGRALRGKAKTVSVRRRRGH